MLALLRIDSSPDMYTCMKLPGWPEANTIENRFCCYGDLRMKKTPELHFHDPRESYQHSRALRQRTRLSWQSSSRFCCLAHLDLLLQPGWHRQVHTPPSTQCTQTANTRLVLLVTPSFLLSMKIQSLGCVAMWHTYI